MGHQGCLVLESFCHDLIQPSPVHTVDLLKASSVLGAMCLRSANSKGAYRVYTLHMLTAMMSVLQLLTDSDAMFNAY
jgi:hypothetical protein